MADDQGDVRRLLEVGRPFRFRLGVVAGLSLLGGLFEAVLLVSLVRAALAISTGTDPRFDFGPVSVVSFSVGRLLLVAAGFGLLRLAAQLVSVWLSSTIGAEVQRALRQRLVDSFLGADALAQAQTREGHLQQLLSVEAVRAGAAVSTACAFVAAACNLGMLTLSTFLVDALAATFIVATLAVLSLCIRPMSRLLGREATSRSRVDGELATALAETIRLSDELRVFGVSNRQQTRLATLAAASAQNEVRVSFVNSSVNYVYQTATTLFMVGALAVVSAVAEGRVANLGAVILILIRAFAYAQQAQSYRNTLIQCGPSLRLVQSEERLLLAHPERRGTATPRDVSRIEFRDVSYSYPGRDFALSGLTFSVEAGEIVGVVGASGAGKSTLAHLLLGLKKPEAGIYEVSGLPSHEIAPGRWAEMVSHVPQDPKLLTGTVEENIRFLREAEFAQVERAARQAHIHHEIVGWEGGYARVIGQRSNAVSGGQKQRLCIARALLTQPGLLVLDEATSALDARSEELVQETLSGLRGRATVFVIAHRPSTLKVCDRVMVLDKGALVAFDTADRLRASNPFFRHAFAEGSSGRP